MNTTSKTLALLLAVMCIIIPVAAVEEEEICVVVQDSFSTYPHLMHISFVTSKEFPEHAELSPFFRDDLVETEEPAEISEDITAWFRCNETPAECNGSVSLTGNGEKILSSPV